MRPPWIEKECPECGAAADEPCVGWCLENDGTMYKDGFDGPPCPNAPARHKHTPRKES